MDKTLMTHCRYTGNGPKTAANASEFEVCVNCTGPTSKAELEYRKSKRCSHCGNPVDEVVNP